MAYMANQTYLLEQAVDMIGAPSRRWLIERLRDGRFPGRKIGREWRMTDEDISTVLDLCRNDAQVTSTPTGLTPRSRARAAAHVIGGLYQLADPQTKGDK
jgi:hypothetical protein